MHHLMMIFSCLLRQPLADLPVMVGPPPQNVGVVASITSRGAQNDNGVPRGFAVSDFILSVEAVNTVTGARVAVSDLQTPANIVVPLSGRTIFDPAASDIAQCVFQDVPQGDVDWARDNCVGLPNPRPEVGIDVPLAIPAPLAEDAGLCRIPQGGASTSHSPALKPYHPCRFAVHLQGITVRWKTGFAMGDGALLVDAWTVDSTDATAGCTSYARVLETANDAYYAGTGYRVFEGDCKLTDPGNIYGCHWNNSAQAFVGPRCVQSAQQDCMCTHFTDFAAIVGPAPLVVYSTLDVLEAGTAVVNAVLILGLLLALIGLLLAGGAYLWNARQRRDLLRRLQGEDCGFQALSGGAWAWEWAVDLSNPSSPGGPGPALAAAIGIPWARLHAALPDADALGIGPPTPSSAGSELGSRFGSCAVGTALVHAWLGVAGVLPAAELARQGHLANEAFAGCHPMGLAALVERFRAMLMPGGRSLMGAGWMPRAFTWRLIFAQGPGGLWSSAAQAEAAAQALGALPMPPFNAGATDAAYGALGERAMDKAPPELRALGDSNGPSLWVSTCAMVHLEQAGEGWLEGSPTGAGPAAGQMAPQELANRGLVAALSRLGPLAADGSINSGGAQNDEPESATARAAQLLEVRNPPPAPPSSPALLLPLAPG